MSVALALLVALGGGLGAALRYGLDSWIMRVVRSRAAARGDTRSSYPWGITVVNLSGSFVLGLLLGAGIGWPLLVTGVLGGYTTFSTASLDSLRLARERRYGAAMLNAFGMLIAAALLAALGIVLGRAL